MKLGRAILPFLILLAACSQEARVVQTPQAQPQEPIVPSMQDPRCWYGGCEGPFYSANPVRFSRYEVGDRIDRIPDDAVTRSGDCQSATDDFHCSFTLSDGVGYLIYEHWVARKRMTLPNSHPLPFGLRGDETQDEVARLVRNLVGVDAKITTLRSGGTLVSHEGTLGTLENPMWLQFRLDEEGRLIEITWQGPPTV
jgi:hypothetical protein